ncbi:MAG: hypothetical protein JNJ49_10790 [Bdellovibrionaceae bacterium]|nr:hypothetical protein [Pseudobdellovibrionaceae bacterium]
MKQSKSLYAMELGALALALAAYSGCANAPRAVKDDVPSVNSSAARDAKAHDFVEIAFDQGSADLTDSAKASLSRVIEQAAKTGKIDEVIVLSWSDQEYPSAATKQLPKPQRELAGQRNKMVEQYLRNTSRVSVDTYNMAEHPTTFSKWFNTTDSKLKNSFLAAGLPTTADAPHYPSKASHSVVLVKVE